MAGVTDRPFRQLCKRLGAGYGGVGDGRVQSAAVGHREDRAGAPITTAKSSRSPCRSPAPIRAMLADAARYNVDRGAQIIDINMGCPAKKVCNVAAGSALLQNEPLVARDRRRGRARGRRAGDAEDPHRLATASSATRVAIARIAEDAGIAALAVHGRTRACAFVGAAEYDTIARGQARSARFR